MYWNKLILLVLLVGFQSCTSPKRFSNTTIVESTDLKNQKYTGQCWSFASTSLLEAEALRLGYDIPELSAFYFVYRSYLDNANEYLKNSGKLHLISSGDLTFSVLDVFNNYGMVPEEIYNGQLAEVTTKKEMKDRWKEEDEMNALIKVKLDSLINSESSLDKSMNVIEHILNDYLGKAPEQFLYNNKTYTPKTFAERFLPINAADYIELTSYKNHPFYRNIILQIPANWRNKTYLNVPIEDFSKIIDNALNNEFTMAWDGDIGTSGGFKENGYVNVRGEYEDEQAITQEQRQSTYDQKTTTDDHNMHLVGITYDQNGQKFYILKNTWGENRGMDGLWYFSENYFKLRTISVTVHKDAIPKDIISKVGN